TASHREGTIRPQRPPDATGAAAVPSPNPLETTVRPALPVDLGLTLGPLRRGRDPSMRVDPSGTWWRATLTPNGPATACYAARAAASRASRLDALSALPPAEARRRMQSLPGVGPWTAAEVALVALGDPDAVPVGDFHLPHLVSNALAGEPRGSDERMLELLA